MTMQDAYKWLYQATLGGEHAIEDDTGPRQWLNREWAGLRPHLPEPLTHKLTPEGRVLRVNLRPYKRSGGDKEMLLALFVSSAQQFRPEKYEFITHWRNLGDVLAAREKRLTWIPIAFRKAAPRWMSYREWQRIDRETRPLGYPAVHHSEGYERRYKPAYRVVLGELWQ